MNNKTNCFITNQMRCKMKKAIVVLVLLILPIFTQAQSALSSGSASFGGTISYNSRSDDNKSSSINIFTFNPSGGYFFIDNLYTALSLSYLAASSSDISSYGIGFGPVIKYYASTPNSFKPFLGLAYNYMQYWSSQNDDKVKSTEVRLSGGVNYFVTDSFALEASINYSFISNTISSSTYKSKVFNIGIGANYFVF